MSESNIRSLQEEISLDVQNELFKYPHTSLKQDLKLNIKNLYHNKKIIKKDYHFWPNALLAISMEYDHKVKNQDNALHALKKYYDSWISRGNKILELDHCLNGYSLIYVYEQTKEKKYKDSIDKIFKYLMNHPRTFDGNIPYRLINKDEVFIDSLGMICPFLARYAKTYNEEAGFELSSNILTLFLKNGIDELTGLPYHAYNESSEKNGIIGWGRGVGWLAIGLIDTLEYLPTHHPQYDYLLKSFKEISCTLMTYQKKDGSFPWVLTAVEGPSDTSPTSMIFYSIKKAINLNLIEKKYQKNVDLAISFLLGKTNEGKVYQCSAECGGLGVYPQTYSSYPWSQGPTNSLLILELLN